MIQVAVPGKVLPRSLTHLSLSKNKIGDDGLIALASALLARSSPLKQCILLNNRYAAPGIAAFLPLLRSLSREQSQNYKFDFSRLSDSEFLFLAPALPHFSSLQRIAKKRRAKMLAEISLP
jgi:hypothetical protein